jgi:hypothetical protein
MPAMNTDIYRSSNGDRWLLIHDDATGKYTVRHEPNLASGGQATETELDEFLARSGTSPQDEVTLQAMLGGNDDG